MKTMPCGCRWDGWALHRCARHREPGSLARDALAEGRGCASMSGRIQTVTEHGDTFCTIALIEECPECASFKTDLRMEAKAQRRRYYECRVCRCEWISTSQPSVEAKPIVIEGKEEPVKKIEQYKHHGVMVSVRKDLRGMHREHCLCYQCERFRPTDRAANCVKANELYALCVRFGVTTPVWECPDFESK